MSGELPESVPSSPSSDPVTETDPETPTPTPTTTPSAVHRPVLAAEVVAAVAAALGENCPTHDDDGPVVIDGTVGAGGHAALMMPLLGPRGRLVGFDRDPAMLALAGARLNGLPATLVHASYAEIPRVLGELGIVPSRVRAILLDLGLSSDQLAWTHRGFSFQNDGPLDMRFDPDLEQSAADLIRCEKEETLADIFYHYGEEHHSRRIARKIVDQRKRNPILTTGELSALVKSCVPWPKGKGQRYGKPRIDPATRVFQALRIAVNEEFVHLETTLKFLPDVLIAPGSRIMIISFHSLEDRRVKIAFRDHPAWRVITKKPIVAGPDEAAENPRSRSAKLRVAERCPIA